jgi:hypothetical protein
VNPIRAAIVQRLTPDSTLTSMLSSAGAIYHRVAPRTAHTPFIVFDHNAGGWTSLFAGGKLTEAVWMVKAVDHNNSASRAEDIDARVAELLHGVTLDLSNGAQAHVLREADIDYAEREGDDAVQHVGGLYRVIDP